MDSGEERLKALGYKQELKRDFTLVSNTAISFSIISTLTGITGKPCANPSAMDCRPAPARPTTSNVLTWRDAATGSLPLAYDNGGPPTAVWGWILVSAMTVWHLQFLLSSQQRSAIIKLINTAVVPIDVADDCRPFHGRDCQFAPH